MHLNIFPHGRNDLSGLHYAARIFIGTSLLWFLLQSVGEINPLWAIISLIDVTEPNMECVWSRMKVRIIKTIAGCIIGLLFLLCIGRNSWILPFALTSTVLVSTYLIRNPLGWRIAPITTAIIMAAGMTSESTNGVNMGIALHRTMEILLGSVVALLVTWGMSLIWVIRYPKNL